MDVGRLFCKINNFVEMNQEVHRRTLLLNLLTQNMLRLFGPRREKTCLRGFANNTGADQPAHPRSLISAFVIRFLKSVISKLATSEILVF